MCMVCVHVYVCACVCVCVCACTHVEGIRLTESYRPESLSSIPVGCLCLVELIVVSGVPL